MKAKSILLAATVVAASALSSSAQTVFSVNAVGFVNKTFPNGQFALASNPLSAANNTVDALFPDAPAGCIIYKFDGAGFGTPNTRGGFGTLAWSNPGMTLVPGEAFFFRNNSGSDYTVTFVGDVPQGTLTTPLNDGFSLVASQVPVVGGVGTDLKLPEAAGTVVYTWNGTTYTPYSLGGFGSLSWSPSEPIIGVGQGFWVRRSGATEWKVSFDVNNGSINTVN